jgi:hypothetical protein
MYFGSVREPLSHTYRLVRNQAGEKDGEARGQD